MITTATPQEEVDALRERVADLENQLARQAQTVSVLQENEERLQAVLNNLRDAPYRRNLRTDSYDYLSPVIETLTGWSVEDLNQAGGETVLSRIHPEDLPRVRQELERTNKLCREAGRATESLEYRFRTKAGEYCWLGDDLTVVVGEDGEPLYRLGVMRDITERKQAETALHTSEARYRLLVETANEGIWAMDGAHRTTYVNQAMAEMLGYAPAKMLGKKVEDFFFAEDMAFHGERMRRRHAGQDEVYERRFKRRDGSVLWTLVSARVIKDSQGEFNGSFAMFTDITERKRAEAALRESEERFRLFMDNSPMTAWMQDDQSRYVYLNQTYEKRFGVRLDQWQGKSIFEIWPADVAEQFEKSNQQVLAAGHLQNFTQTIPNPAGGESTWWIFKFPFQAGSGQRYVAGIGLDITERRQTEEALYLTHYSLQRVTDAIYWLDEAGRIVDVNETACRMLGYSREELLRGSIFDLDAGITPELWQEYWRQLKEAGVWQGEVTHRSKAGRLIPVEVMANYIEFGERALNCSFVRDISERQQAEAAQARLEEQLRQAQKMESIGRLAGGVAHDFNNLLTVILGYSELVQARLPLGSSALDQIEQIRRSAKRAEDLTHQLLAFSRKQILVPVVLDLSELVGNLRKMLARLIGEDIALTTVLQPDLGAVEADPGQLEQVLLNLVVNARDAMPAGGRLSIETAQVAPEDPFRQTHPEAESSPWVRLTVTDTGHGMDEATRSRIFEPFFTTKEQGKGTGLGLATVYGIVKQSGGEITVESQPGQGASFTIYLPAHQAEGLGSPVAEPEPVAGPGRGTILLVEDEAVVRDFVRTVLAEYGYTLLEAEHGYQALALAQQEKSLDLLLTDVVMPNIGGWELAERISALHPELKVLFMSGYTDDEVIRHGVRKAEVEFLTKPFSPVALAVKVRALLDK